MSNNLTVANLNVKLDMELNRLNAQITQANAKVARMSRTMHSDVAKAAKSMNAALSTLGVGLSVAGVVAFGKSIIDLGGKITDLSRQAGIGTDAFQTLSVVAMDSGVSGEQLAQSFVKMRQNIQEAVSGNKTAIQSFSDLGLNAKALKQIAPEQQFEVIAKRIATATDRNAAFNAALDILGAKTAPKLQEVLQRLGTEGFEKLGEETKKLKLSPAQLDSLDKAGDALERIALNLKLIGAKGLLNISATVDGGDKNAKPGSLGWRMYQGGMLGGEDASSLGLIKEKPSAFSPASIDAIFGAKNGSSDAYDKALSLTKQSGHRSGGSYGEFSAMLASEGDITKEELEAIDAKTKQIGASLKNTLDRQQSLNENTRRYNATLEETASTFSTALEPALDDFFSTLDNKSATMVHAVDNAAKMMDGIWENAADNASSALADMVIDGEASFDKLASSFARMVIEMTMKMAIMKGMQSMGLVSSIAGGGMATGGAIGAFGMSRVNESGPELLSIGNDDYLMMGSKPGSITPNSQLTTATTSNGGDINIRIDATGADAAGLRRVESAIRDLDRNFASRAKAAVSDGRQRGERI